MIHSAQSAKAQSHPRASAPKSRNRPQLTGQTLQPEDALTYFNSHFLIGIEDGVPAIYQIEEDGRLIFLPEPHFKMLTENILVDDRFDPRYDGVVAGHIWWRGHPQRTTRTLVFKPQGDIRPGEYNLWQGFALKPKKGDKLMQPLLQHIKEVICRNDPTKFEYTIRWLAFAVQHPELTAETAIVLKSTKQGTGKTTLGKVMCDIFGLRHSATVRDKNAVIGRFNDWLGPMSFLLCEEILFAKDYSTVDKLKALITGASLQVERKFSSVRQVPNHLHLMLTSNHELPVSLGSADRRYFILDVAEDRIGDKTWFSRIYRDLAKGGTAQFLNYLQIYELGSWHPRELLKTAETIEAQHESASPVLQWLQACVDDDHTVGTDGMNKLPLGKFIEANELRKAYTRFCKEHNLHPDAPNIFGKQMKKLFGDKKRISVSGGYDGAAPRPWAYYIPEGEDLQARIDASLGLSQSQ